MNGVVLCRVQAFAKKGAESDINGVQNVILVPLAGKIPSRRVIAGTVALGSGLSISDEPVLISYTEQEASEEYGRQFSFVSAGKSPNILETMQLMTTLGEPMVINVEDKEPAAAQTAAKPGEGVLSN